MAQGIRRPPRPRPNPLLVAGVTTVDWKDIQLLRQFISDRGKIRSRRVTRLTPRQQREASLRDQPLHAERVRPVVVDGEVPRRMDDQREDDLQADER